LLKLDRLAPGIKAPEIEVFPLNPTTHIVDRILRLNRILLTLEKYREKADKKDSSYTLENNLLLYKDRLIVSVEADETLLA
jgi:hypothetical protein